MSVTVYTTPTCPYCRQVKEYLKSRSVPFTERDVTQEPGAAEEMVRLSGQQGVPVTVAGAEVIVGYDRPRLDSALAALERPRLGAAVADATRSAHGAEGAYIGRVRPGGVAERAGLRAGDVIVSLADHQVNGAIGLEQLVARVRPGGRLAVEYLRDGQVQQAMLQF
ncbi:MAG: PDZ domain-containing protein [Chloroflexi bacterium]|nr:PDZ domain-containing protein [Chloroflexota bacterium]